MKATNMIHTMIQARGLCKFLAIVAAGIALPATVGAVDLDLTATPISSANTVTTDDGVIYSQTDQQPTGTGYIDPFLRVQGNSSGHAEITDGYNTSDAKEKNPMWDKPYPYTHDLLLSDLATVAMDNVDYYCFLLDANQTGTDPKLTMSQFEIFVSDTAADNSYSTQAELQAAFTSVYNMVDDSLGGASIDGLDLAVQNTNGFDANNGSGSGDLYVYLPTSLFSDGTYLILYSEFGDGTYIQNDGFEEWAACTTTSVPDNGSTLVLLGAGMAGLAFLTRRQKPAFVKA